MNVLIKFGRSKSSGVKGHGVKFTVRGVLRENSCKCIVRCICLHNQGAVRCPMSSDRCRRKCLFQLVERFSTVLCEAPRESFPCESSKGNSDGGIVVDKMPVKFCKTKERLDVFYFPRFWPLQDVLNLIFSYGESLRQQYVAKVFDRGLVKRTFVFSCI